MLRKHINNSEKLKESSILSRVDPFINLIKRVLTILIPWSDDDVVAEMFNNCVINKLLNSIAAAAVDVAMLTKSLRSFMLSSRLMSGKKLLHIHHFFINLITRLFLFFFVYIKLLCSLARRQESSQVLINFLCFCCCRFLLMKNCLHWMMGMVWGCWKKHLNMKVLIVLTIYGNHCYFVCIRCDVK